jgi:hypothetical protein
MQPPTCPECGAAVPSCPWTGPPITCLNCRTTLGRSARRPARRPARVLFLAAVMLMALVAVCAF